MYPKRTKKNLELILSKPNPPKKLWITGPAGAGKTRIAKKVAEHFNLPITITDVTFLEGMSRKEAYNYIMKPEGYCLIGNFQALGQFIASPNTPPSTRESLTGALKAAIDREYVIFESQGNIICLAEACVDAAIVCDKLDTQAIVEVIKLNLGIDVNAAEVEKYSNRITLRELERKIKQVSHLPPEQALQVLDFAG